MSGRARANGPGAAASGVSPAAVLEWLEAVRRAIVRRDVGAVARLLARREAGATPRELREEALALAAASSRSLRAPVALLRFAHQVRQLADAGEPMPGAGPRRARRRGEAVPAQLELPWPGRAERGPRRADAPREDAVILRPSLARGAAALHRCASDRQEVEAAAEDADSGGTAARPPHPEPGARMTRWTDSHDGLTAAGRALADGSAFVPTVATPSDAEQLQSAEAALDEHWALHSLRRPRRAEILAAAESRHATLTGRPVPVSLATPADRVALPSRRGRGAPPLPVRVADADVVHLAGAYDLAGRDAILRLEARRRAAPAEGDDAPPQAAVELTLAASRAYALQAVLPLHGAAGAATGAPPDGPRREGARPEGSRSEDEGVLHRLLLLAALAEVGQRRADWLRWLEQCAPELAARPALRPVAAPHDAASPAPDLPWELRCRSLVVGVWIEVLRRSGPSGLDDAMALLARLREERESAEPAWLAEVERAGGEAAVVRANFALFALGHLADAAVDTLLYLRHGDAHLERGTLERTLRLRLGLAREAAAGDVQWDGLLAWLGEAARLVVARRTPQLEIGGGW